MNIDDDDIIPSKPIVKTETKSVHNDDEFADLELEVLLITSTYATITNLICFRIKVY